jgi:VCBS repeat-containing protein
MSNDKKTNIIGGSRNDDGISGTGASDKILGHGGDDTLGGSSGGDRVFGSTGNDVLRGGSGNDWLKGDTGEDVLDGGAGSDRIDGRAGNDVAVYVLAENTGSDDEYDGGSGIDTLRLVFTSAEWARADVKADVARFMAFLANEINPSGQAKGHEFEFRAFDLEVTKFEKLEVVVDGRVIDPRGGPTIDAVNDAATVAEDGSISGNVLANDLVPTLSAVALVTGPAHGTLTFGGDGSYAYTPGADFNALAVGESATETFVYRVTDTSGNTDTATVTLTITGTNDGPVARADVAAGTENQTLTINVLGNDSDPDHNAVLHVTAAAVPAGQGAVTVNTDNTLAFDPGSDFDHLAAGATATVTAAYTVADQQGATSASTVAITVTGTNDAPVMSVVSASGAVREDVTPAATGQFAAVDADDGAVLAWSVVGGGAGTYGSLAVDATGAWTYQLANATLQVQALSQGEVVTETFTVRVADQYGAGDTKLVTVTITGTNDGPVAQADVAAGTENQPLTINVLGNDTDIDHGAVLHVTAAAVPAGQGAVTINGDNTLAFNPGNDFDHLAAGATATVNATYTVADQQGATSIGTVIITVTGVNDAPVARADTYASDENQVLVVGGNGVLANDTDPDAAAALGVVAGTYTTALGATVVLNADGSFSYDPRHVSGINALHTGESAADIFTYTAVDDRGATSSATATVSIRGIDHAPVATADSFATDEDMVLTGNVLANDVDLDGDTLTVTTTGTIFTPQGRVEMNADGTFTYTPLHDYSGPDHFAYAVTDGHGGTSTVDVTLAVNAVADAPRVSVPENNLGFERGSIAGWSAIGSVAALQWHDGVVAPEKSWMGWIDASGASEASIENFVGLAAGALDEIGSGDATVGSALKTALTVMAGDVISFDWNFNAHDYLPYNDFAFVVTADGVAYKLSDIEHAGAYQTTEWTTYSLVAPTTGVFELAIGMMNVTDESLNSHLLIDNIRINGAAPDVRGTEDIPIPLDLAAALVDLDGSESLSITMSNMPHGTLFSAGADAGDGRWILSPGELPGLTMTTPHDYNGLFTLTVTATATESSNGSTANTDKSIVVMVQPANDAPVAVSDSAATNEDTKTLIDVVMNDTDADHDVLSIHDLLGSTSAYGATLSIVDGKVLYDPSTSGALHALAQGETLTDGFDYTVTDQRGGTSTAHVAVTVAGVDDVGMQGVSLDYTYLYTDIDTAIYTSHVVAGAEVEVNGLWGAASPGTLDLTDDRIVLDFASSGTATAAAFNGFHLSDYSGALPNILDVTVAQNNIAGFTDSRITHDANNVFVNLQGLSYDANSHLELQVVF